MTKNGFLIIDWMVTDKGLSGNELVCYAYLFQQTDGGKQPYRGGYENIAKAIGVTFPTAYNVLKKLKERGLVEYEAVNEVSLSAGF